MSSLVPFKKNRGLINFYDAIDDFFIDGWVPTGDWFKVDVTDLGDEYFIEADMPGVKKNEVKLSVENDILRIDVNREEDVNAKEKKYLHKERLIFSSTRSIRLDGAQANKITANLVDGILFINVPKDEKAKVKTQKIEIKID